MKVIVLLGAPGSGKGTQAPILADPLGVPHVATGDLRWLAWSPAAYPFNLTGQPALSLPVGLTPAGLPVGLQLVGRVGDDGLVLSAAGLLETALGLTLTPPGIATEGK